MSKSYRSYNIVYHVHEVKFPSVTVGVCVAFKHSSYYLSVQTGKCRMLKTEKQTSAAANIDENSVLIPCYMMVGTFSDKSESSVTKEDDVYICTRR